MAKIEISAWEIAEKFGLEFLKCEETAHQAVLKFLKDERENKIEQQVDH